MLSTMWKEESFDLQRSLAMYVESSWNVMAHDDAREGSEGETAKWSG